MLYELLSFTEGDFPAGLGWHDRVLLGFPQNSLWTISRFLGVEATDTAALVGLPEDELNWKKRGQPVSADISNKLFNIARAYQRLMVVLKDEDAVRTWLRTAQRDLDTQIPILLLMTQPGAAEVLRVIASIKPVETVEMNTDYDEPSDDAPAEPSGDTPGEEDEPQELV